MNPTPAAIAWIVSQSPDWMQTDAALASNLNAVLTANPVPQGTMPQPLTAPGLLSLLSGASTANLRILPELTFILNEINTQKGENVREWAAFLASGDAPSITMDEAQAIVAATTATRPDPTWTAELPIPVIVLGRLLDVDDLAAARATLS